MNNCYVYLWKRKDEELTTLINKKVFKKHGLARRDLEDILMRRENDDKNDYEIVKYRLVREE